LEVSGVVGAIAAAATADKKCSLLRFVFKPGLPVITRDFLLRHQ